MIGKGPDVRRLGLKQTKNANCIVKPSVADNIVQDANLIDPIFRSN